MFRYLRFFLGPLLFSTTSVLMFFGGVLLWLPAMALIAGVSLLDQIFPHDVEEKPYRFPWLMDLALYMSTPAALLLFFALFWVAGSGAQDALGAGAFLQSLTGIDVVAARNGTAWYHVVLMFVPMTLVATGIGGLAGHELTHRTARPFDLWLGRVTMALNWGIAFPIEHVYGHHAYVGTIKDPATAARGDSVYAHLPKAMKRTVVNAWEIEKARLAKRGKSFWSPSNVILRMAGVAATTTAFAFYCAGWRGVAFHLVVCVLTKVALEVLNYVEHYGIVRQPSQPVQPRHSWNCNHTVSGVLTYNLTRHSHHHADAQTPFQDLRAHAEQPSMPGGFITAYLTAWVPPLWRRAITPKLLEWDRTQADRAEFPLIRAANNASGWAELKQSVANSTSDTVAIPQGGLGY
ncbi:MAG: Alkane 1-monooxygenase family protein [Moraxellaceae bacterium]|jgi:alkane 1-monooxygenase|nr:Alkane 1-monooxygenase family protein [Moraxellaceae bacterium]